MKKKIEEMKKYLTEEIWDKLLPDITKPSPKFEDEIRDLYLLSKVLEKIMDELKTRAVKFPSDYKLPLVYQKRNFYPDPLKAAEFLIKRGYSMDEILEIKSLAKLKCVKEETKTLMFAEGLVDQKISVRPNFIGG